MSKKHNGKDASIPITIKKYANRRLYDTGRSSYVTLDDLRQMVKDGQDFVVVDAKSNEDLTRSVLAQIILDQESKEETLLPTNFLKSLISFYGENTENMVPNYLESTLNIFMKNQEELQKSLQKSLDEIGAPTMPEIFSSNPVLEEINRQNMALLERTMEMFTPFTYGKPQDKSSESKSQPKEG